MFIEFNLANLSERDASALQPLAEVLRNFSSIIRQFEHALILHRALLDLTSHQEWKHLKQCRLIPAKDGVMALSHLYKILDKGIPLQLKILPDYRKTIDMKVIKEARKTFTNKFPGVIPLRDTVAHDGEHISTDHAETLNEGAEQNANGSGKVSIYISGSIVGDTFVSMKHGQSHGYDLNENSLQALKDIEAILLSAFPNAVIVNF